jgi:NADH-quinone oxidoreductase subunit G
MLGNLLLLKQENGAEGGGHAGRRNNGLIAVWPRGNTQGAWDMGIAPHLKPGYEPVAEPGLGAEAILAAAADGSLKALYLLGADPIGDGQMSGRGGLDFLVVQELFLTESAKAADVVLPAQSWAEREGTFTNGERRVQRFYPAISVSGDSRADWQILAHLGERVGLGKPAAVASLAFGEIAANVALYKDLSYRALAWTEEQWPIIGGRDLFYGGTAFANKSGLGLQWPAAAESGRVERFDLPDLAERAPEGLALVEVTALYEPGTVFDHTHLLEQRRAEPALILNAADGQNLGIADGETVRVAAGDASLEVPARVDGQAPAGVALLSGARLRRGRAPVSITRVT